MSFSYSFLRWEQLFSVGMLTLHLKPQELLFIIVLGNYNNCSNWHFISTFLVTDYLIVK
jgi:hypothetical protein